MWNRIKPYVISTLISLGVGALAAWLTRENMDIYETVTTPPLSPPGWLFPVVWTILYILMGVGSAIIYKKGKTDGINTKAALDVYLLQLTVNFIWSIVFFNMRLYLQAFLWLIFLWALIIVMIKRFYTIDKTAAKLQIPYLLWVTFAGYLNFAIWLMNR